MNDIERARFLSMIEQQRQGLQEPWVDPVSAGAGGFGALLPKALSRLMAGAGLKALARPVVSGAAGALSDYPIGALTDSPRIPDAAKLPVNIALGMGTGIGADAMSRLMAQSGLMRQAGHLPPMRNPLANEMGQVDAWHGSPHTFDKFSSARIGTGEGAQAFGHGLYFTDKEEIARHYANKLGNQNSLTDLTGRLDRVRIGNKKLSDYGLQGSTGDIFLNKKNDGAADSFDAWLKIDEKLEQWKDLAKDPEYKFKDYAEKQIRALSQISKDMEQGAEVGYNANRNLYKVTINKGRDDVWLDWDKPVGKDKNASIVNALKGLDKKKPAVQARIDGGGWPEQMSGSEIYHSLAQSLGSDKDASMFLRELGIDGIRYPTESLSGKKGSDKFNYVVFDENAVEINDKISY